MIDKAEIERCYEIARAARALGYDPSDDVDILLAPDMAARVEGITGPPGVAAAMREIKDGRTQTAFKVAKMVLEGKFPVKVAPYEDPREKLIAQAVRTGTAILTEGVLVAPTEGIAGFQIRKNPDGSDYLAVLYAGPIRSAGGTSVALSVLLADFARQYFNIGEWRPTDTAIERYLEEIMLYDMRAARLQYKPSDDDIRHVVRNCPICVDGEPTEEFEVGVHRNVPGIVTNRIRGGVALVICEGIAQKAASVQSNAKKLGLNWAWLEAIIKVAKAKEKTKPKANDKFLDEVIAGRPIFSYPSAKNGFRLRYGRTRITGLMAKAIHPATMVALDGFPAIGTQLRIERPGKSCVLSPCSVIEGPIVKLMDGSVVRLTNVEEAIQYKEQISRIMWVGDILIAYGDFFKTKTPLHPAGYCEEWWALEYKEAAAKKNVKVDVNPFAIDAREAFRISEEFGIPLHPRWTYFWDNITGKEAKQLINWLKNADAKYEWFTMREIRIMYDPSKEILERILFPHRVEKDTLVMDGHDAFALFKTLRIETHRDERSITKLLAEIDDNETGLNVASKLAGVKVADKAGTWIGCRMGRPEKSRERLMKPAPHVLFPIGEWGGKTRNIVRAYKKIKSKEIDDKVNVDIARMHCRCGNITYSRICEKCGDKTVPERVCNKCGRISLREMHDCVPGGTRTSLSEKRDIDIVSALDKAIERCKHMPDDLKGVVGMMSESKMPEPMEKGILRSKNRIYVFKDGTCRFDATNMPLTHFYPKEANVTVEKLRKIGYTKDAYGNDLQRDDQLVEIQPQDMIVSERCLEYMYKVAQFVDDELTLLYGQKPFYSLTSPQDVIGQLVIHLSPHTSAGITSRIVGTTKAHVMYLHPYNIAASRRNCDGDENAIMLMMDALINFSKSYLPRTRGGTMDAPLVLMSHIDPTEVDDEVHAMEVVKGYPLEFYRAAQELTAPADVVLEKVSDRLGKPNVATGLWFTHESSPIQEGVTVSRYITLKSMRDKIDAQLVLATKIDAVDAQNAAERVLLSHFLPDIYGNLHSFARQQFRCVGCNAKFRRVPLIGKCLKCGGKLILTINRGGVEKYLKLSQEVADKYNLPHYLKQRLTLLERDILCLFEDETTKQFNLAEFM